LRNAPSLQERRVVEHYVSLVSSFERIPRCSEGGVRVLKCSQYPLYKATLAVPSFLRASLDSDRTSAHVILYNEAVASSRCLYYALYFIHCFLAQPNVLLSLVTTLLEEKGQANLPSSLSPLLDRVLFCDFYRNEVATRLLDGLLPFALDSYEIAAQLRARAVAGGGLPVMLAPDLFRSMGAVPAEVRNRWPHAEKDIGRLHAFRSTNEGTQSLPILLCVTDPYGRIAHTLGAFAVKLENQSIVFLADSGSAEPSMPLINQLLEALSPMEGAFRLPSLRL